MTCLDLFSSGGPRRSIDNTLENIYFASVIVHFGHRLHVTRDSLPVALSRSLSLNAPRQRVHTRGWVTVQNKIYLF